MMPMLYKLTSLRCVLMLSIFMLLYWKNNGKTRVITIETCTTIIATTTNPTTTSIAPQLSRTTWICMDEQCVESGDIPGASQQAGLSLATCSMMCGNMPLWPAPTGASRRGTTFTRFRFEALHMGEPETKGRETHRMVTIAGELFLQNVKQLLHKRTPNHVMESVINFTVSVRVTGSSSDDNLTLKLSTNESYRLVVKKKDVLMHAAIEAATFFGARHGLETLSQMIWVDEEDEPGMLRIYSHASVVDSPRFRHRGILVDSARNFLPMSSLFHTIDAMAASKLNTLHWHLTDSQSFPFDSPRQPNMVRFGAYSRDKVYSPRDVAALVEYSRVRGVRVLAEMDTPAHAGAGWQWGQAASMGNITLCYHEEDWKRYCGEPPCGQLNPTNAYTYMLVKDLYDDLVHLTCPTDLFHVGGDEVDLNCWAKSKEVTRYLDKVNKENLLNLWGTFQKRALMELDKVYDGSVIVWSSLLTRPKLARLYLPKERYVVQVWGASKWGEMLPLLTDGYRVILSHVDAWYLDCGHGSWRSAEPGSCGPYSSWQKVYVHRPWTELKLTAKKLRLVLGGEACLWGEQTDHNSLDSRLWPRAAALAERLWTDPLADDDQLRDAHTRLSLHRERLVTRGVGAAALWPEWCHRHPRRCLEPLEPSTRKF